ncbi:MAG: pyridoxal-phosphate dependent enzyme [Candidatus Levybacteria bacterium]|nr:pyridoxal-phosphate dependent enzyme [Candidatus Levybacteria bacterium]
MVNNLSKDEEKILNSIKVASENDPTKPEFPPDNPKFPATPTYKIKVPGFSNVWLKDESINKYSGTHKDRLAWEVVVLYRNFLIAKKREQLKGSLPIFSIISSGSAAIAIGRMLRNYHLPKLNVLVDTNLDPKTYEAIKTSHCRVFKTDLRIKPFSTKEILSLTDNEEGFDLTSNQGVGLETGNFDWMSYEILNISPDYCFIPFGTGTLFEKVLEINKLEVAYSKHDPRFTGNINKLANCNFMGATTKYPSSKADKLFAYHLPFSKIDEEMIRFYITSGFCGTQTGIYLIKEAFLERAIGVVKSQEILFEPSGIAGLALMLQMRDKLPKNKKMLIINTGKTKL